MINSAKKTILFFIHFLRGSIPLRSSVLILFELISMPQNYTIDYL